jgi:hypothetical protein
VAARRRDLARVSNVLGVDLTRISKLAGEHMKMNAKVSFGNGAVPTQTPEKGKPPGA